VVVVLVVVDVVLVLVDVVLVLVVVVDVVVVLVELEVDWDAVVSTSLPGGAAMTASTVVVESSAHETIAAAIIPIIKTVR
jgi:hypothetical protein